MSAPQAVGPLMEGTAAAVAQWNIVEVADRWEHLAATAVWAPMRRVLSALQALRGPLNSMLLRERLEDATLEALGD